MTIQLVWRLQLLRCLCADTAWSLPLLWCWRGGCNTSFWIRLYRWWSWGDVPRPQPASCCSESYQIRGWLLRMCSRGVSENNHGNSVIVFCSMFQVFAEFIKNILQSILQNNSQLLQYLEHGTLLLHLFIIFYFFFLFPHSLYIRKGRKVILQKKYFPVYRHLSGHIFDGYSLLYWL